MAVGRALALAPVLYAASVYIVSVILAIMVQFQLPYLHVRISERMSSMDHTLQSLIIRCGLRDYTACPHVH